MPPSLRTRQKCTAIRKAAIERDPDAVEHVEAQERARADEAAAEQAEARVVGRRDELDVADLEQARARALDAERAASRDAMFEPTVIAQIASWSHGSR